MGRDAHGSALGIALLMAMAAIMGPRVSEAGISAHEVEVELDLERRELVARDRFTLAAPAPTDSLPLGFYLARSLAITSLTRNGQPVAFVDPDLLPPPASWGGAPLRFVRVTPAGRWGWPLTLEIAYRGAIEDSAAAAAQAADLGPDSNGLIDSAGVFLSGASGWVPEVPGSLFRFRLSVRVPPGYRTMSQGRLMEAMSPGDSPADASSGATARETWSSDETQEEIYLVAGRYTITERMHRGVRMQTYLASEDSALASRYLDATADYLDLYTGLLGPYPYPKFALVENAWQTGFGMPSFTLLGDRVIRLPFIVSTSYGHEILHNWLGNSVYVEWEKGNWCEGLTSYLADHLYKEAEGQGAEYRRGTLQAYRDYVRHANDFPLTAFRSRHDPATQAVGYGKSMMTFHMLRKLVGDDAFIDGLHRLIKKKQFARASWGDLRAAFEGTSGYDLSSFFAQWVTRTGAPVLTLGDSEVTPMPDGFKLRLEIRQSAPPYSLEVPLALRLQGEKATRLMTVALEDTLELFEGEFPAEPVAIALDPGFDVFRRLDRAEIPPSLGQALGAERSLIILPSGASRSAREAYRAFAVSLTSAAPGTVEVMEDKAVEAADFAGKAVWFLGEKHRLRPEVPAAMRAQLADSAFRAPGETTVIVMADAGDPEQAWVLVDTDADDREARATLTAIAQKLPHYRKYGYLRFSGPAATNVAKAEWRVTSSPLARLLGGARYDPPGMAPDPMAIPAAKPLAELESRPANRPTP